jgi:septum formation protein
MLLRQIGLPFETRVSHVDEPDISSDNPAGDVMTLALLKAETVARQIEEPGRIVLGADTTVVLENRTLGKPGNSHEAEAMLRRLIGRSHRVITGLALVETGSLRRITKSQETVVWMRHASDEEIAVYVATGEPLDKAGAYGAQGYGASLIERVDGCFYNVIGLPLAALVVTLRDFAPDALPRFSP